MKNTVCEILGNNIKRIRKAKSLKQDELAELLGLEVKSLSLIETGNGFASAKTLEKLSTVLKTPISELFQEENRENTEKIYTSILSDLELIKNNGKKLETINFVLKSLL